MFTGIIQEIGKIARIEKKHDVATFTIESKELAPKLGIGDSVCVDGACLTVVEKEKKSFKVQAIPETLKRTISKDYGVGSRVNLEPSMQMADRFHGHIVTGHVDFVGKIAKIESEGETIAITIGFPPAYGKYFAMKGSVTVNGVSLTISKLNAKSFEVQIIPHTQNSTNLDITYSPHNQKKGEVNVEVDLIARYLERLLNAKEDESNYFFLKERGFI